MKEDYNFYRMKTKRLHVEPILASPEKSLWNFFTKEIWRREKGLVAILVCCKTSPELWLSRSLMFSTMVVKLWGLQSKPLQMTGPAQSWLPGAVSSQGLNISEDRHFTTSLGPCSHVRPLLLVKKINLSISLSATCIHSLSSHCCALLRSVWLCLLQVHPPRGSWSQQWGLPWEWVSPWVSPLETLSSSPVSPGSTQESIRDSRRTISLGYHPHYSSQAGWEKQVAVASTSLLQKREHQQTKNLKIPTAVVPSFPWNKCSLSVKMW